MPEGEVKEGLTSPKKRRRWSKKAKRSLHMSRAIQKYWDSMTPQQRLEEARRRAALRRATRLAKANGKPPKRNRTTWRKHRETVGFLDLVRAEVSKGRIVTYDKAANKITIEL